MSISTIDAEPDAAEVTHSSPSPERRGGSQTAEAGHQTPRQPKVPALWHNAITVLGLFLVILTLLLLLTFALFAVVSPATNPYIDIVGYLILPSLLLFGLGLMPSGILLKSWRNRRRDPSLELAFRFPRVDLNDPDQRSVAKFVVVGTFIMLPVVGVSSYHGYHYTDATEFCAKACHEVMEPQGVTHAISPHARVACAECHIGTGASWFVKAKLSGTRQVLAVIANSYSRPIPPAIKHLRPARETCEHCHWPKKFFGAQLREIVHFGGDEKNTRRDISMLVKTGGGDEATGRAEGIHLHMALAGKVEYVATDSKLQVIPWVKLTNEIGEERIFRSDGLPFTDPPPEGQVRKLDCMDCHNRPAHEFQAPEEAVDLQLSTGHIDTTLPFIKRKAVEVLVGGYPDTETAKVQIERKLVEYYKTQYPEVWRSRKASITQAVKAIQDIYATTFFPRMKVDWTTYPDNIGHKYSPGCFRCHEGKHVDKSGETISHSCEICHTFLYDSGTDKGAAILHEGPFKHSFELIGPHATLRCDQCHTGGTSLGRTCSGCHATQDAFRQGTLAEFASFDIQADAMADSVDCESCHDFSEPTSIEAIDTLCMECHEDEEERFEGMLESWDQEVKRLFGECESRTDEQGLRQLRALQQAGPLHNMEATRTILRSISHNSEPPGTH